MYTQARTVMSNLTSPTAISAPTTSTPTPVGARTCAPIQTSWDALGWKIKNNNIIDHTVCTAMDDNVNGIQ